MNLKVETINNLKFIASDEVKDFFILLKGSLIARKRIFYDEISDIFFVEDLVTSEEKIYSLKQLKKNTNIIEAIQNGAFFLETNEAEASNLITVMALLV